MSTPINFNGCQFMVSAPDQRRCPPDEGFEVAFAGRSNAGKSSAINCLTNQSKLARTSKTPGRTQLINFFSLSENVRLVDLPGYGFAKVPLAQKREWDRNLSHYLQTRQSLQGLVIVMDVRHPLQEFDLQMLYWAQASELAVHLLVTKADKLKRGPAMSVLMGIQRTLDDKGFTGAVSMQLFSALKRQGVDNLKQVLRNWLTGAVLPVTAEVNGPE